MNRLIESDLCGFSEALLTDILMCLDSKNKSELDQIDNNCLNLSKFECSSGVVENLMTICNVFGVDRCVKYTSIELFDKLLVQLVCDTKRVFFETTRTLSAQKPALDWPSIEAKLAKQMHLRAVTCVLIAAKLYESQNVPTIREIQEFLHKSGHKYSLQNINRSELRVLKQLNYKLIVNSVDIYVDTLLAVLNHNISGFDSYFQSFHSIANHLIDLYYICRKIIARNALKIMSKRLSLQNQLNASDEELQIERIGSNKMLISSAIIASIPIVIDVSIYEQIINELTEISGFEDNLIIDMSHAILVLICDF